MREFLRELLEVSTKHAGLELSTHKRKSRQPQSVQHFSLLECGARSVTRCGERVSSDELNNKRCKYDNFSQDVASNNKIKIILKVSKVTEKELTLAEEDSQGEKRQESYRIHSDNSTAGGQLCVCAVCGAQENIQFVASFLFWLPSYCSAWLPPALPAFLLLCLPSFCFACLLWLPACLPPSSCSGIC